MEVQKRKDEKGLRKGDFHSEVDHFSMFKGKPMVYIKGSFYQGGFSMSKNKIRAILDNAEFLKRFAEGEFDADIKKLKEDEILKI